MKVVKLDKKLKNDAKNKINEKEESIQYVLEGVKFS